MTPRVTAYGKPGCPTCAHYRAVLDEAAISYDWVDISAGPVESDGVGSIDGPTIVFTGDDSDAVVLRRPTDDDLQRWLERFGFVERTIHHDAPRDDADDTPGEGRYVLPLLGQDAFITYVDRGDVRHITYSEVPAERRGQGLGAELSHKTLDALIAEGRHATFGCGYVAAIADRYQPWQEFAHADGHSTSGH